MVDAVEKKENSGREKTEDLRVTLSGMTLDNPVIPASGTFGYG